MDMINLNSHGSHTFLRNNTLINLYLRYWGEVVNRIDLQCIKINECSNNGFWFVMVNGVTMAYKNAWHWIWYPVPMDNFIMDVEKPIRPAYLLALDILGTQGALFYNLYWYNKLRLNVYGTNNRNNDNNNIINNRVGGKSSKITHKIHTGKRGGKYYIKNGKKIYI
jgi:hypothetical protein